MASSENPPPPPAVRADQVADLDAGLADPPLDRGIHPAVAQVQLGVADGGPGGRRPAPRPRRSRRHSRPSPGRGGRGRPRPATPTASGRPRSCRGPRPSRRSGTRATGCAVSWIWASSSWARSRSSCAAETSRPLDSSAFRSAASASACRARADRSADLVRFLVDHQQELPLLDRRPLDEMALGEEPADAGPDRHLLQGAGGPVGRHLDRHAHPPRLRPRRPSGAGGGASATVPRQPERVNETRETTQAPMMPRVAPRGTRSRPLIARILPDIGRARRPAPGRRPARAEATIAPTHADPCRDRPVRDQAPGPRLRPGTPVPFNWNHGSYNLTEVNPARMPGPL